MRRFTAWFAALVALVLFATGCGGGSTNAATVNGTSISRDALINDADDFAKVEGDPFQLLPAGADASKSPVAYTATGMADVLSRKITDAIVVQAAKRFGVTVTDAEVEQTKADSLSDATSLPARKLDALARQLTLQQKVFEYVIANEWWNDADIAAYYDLVKDSAFSHPCTQYKHILVDTEASAAQILQQLKAGGDFKALAAQNSTDTSSAQKGGELGCAASGDFVAEFEAAVANAKTGDLVGPVKTEYGYHIIWVGQTYHPDSVAGARDLILERFRSEDGQGWAEYAVRSATVHVDRRYGTWSSESFSVVPPEGAQSATPNANTAG
ncbi:MAG TPA: peptidylprolyl isomerase [Acidimicrobiales bacterium]|jgi:foldase protein PrsA|nr:peptidylprolyl isomerase [Acidimicrobiales bacterium]